MKSITNITVLLYDANFPTNTWHLEGGISFRFPTNRSIAPTGCVLIVNFDPVTNLTQLAAFRAKYGVSTNIPLFGPYAGKLKNSSDSVELYKPDPTQLPPHPDAGYVPSILVEKVKFEDTTPWPSPPDGAGYSLHRLSYTGYANDQTNWFSAWPTPGVATPPGVVPQITVQPVGQTVLIGGTVSLSASGTGTAPLGRQWQFNGVNLPGATNNPFVITNAQLAQSGNYTALLTNAYAAVTSAVAAVVIYQPPTIIVPPVSILATQGFTAILSVYAEGSTPISYQWRRFGVDVPSPYGNLLVLANVQTNQTGEYTVVISNTYGAVTSAVATITVGVRAGFDTQPVSVITTQGFGASFSVATHGNPPLHYQWRLNGTNLPGANTNSLVLANVQPGQAGGYTVVVTNLYGASTSAVATLTVGVPPGFSLMPADQYVAVGADVTFAVAATGTEPFSFQWREHGADLPGEALPTLVFFNVQTNQSGLFSAVLANGFGSATSTVARLSIAGPPWLLPLTISTGAIPEITLSGVVGHVYEIEGTPDLIDWVVVSRFTNSLGQQTVTDPDATNSMHRFYRGRLVP